MPCCIPPTRQCNRMVRLSKTPDSTAQASDSRCPSCAHRFLQRVTVSNAKGDTGDVGKTITSKLGHQHALNFRKMRDLFCMRPATVGQRHAISKGNVVFDIMRQSYQGRPQSPLPKATIKAFGAKNVETPVHFTKIKIGRAAFLDLWPQHLKSRCEMSSRMLCSTGAPPKSSLIANP